MNKYQIACLRFNEERGAVVEKEVGVETNDGQGWSEEDAKEVLFNIAEEQFKDRDEVVKLCGTDDALPSWYEGDGFYDNETHEPLALYGWTKFWDGVYLFTIEELQEWRDER